MSKSYKYMHTINGMPAHYYPGEQVCYAVITRPIPLVESLAQIKREQAASQRWRKKLCLEPTKGFGWMKIAV